MKNQDWINLTFVPVRLQAHLRSVDVKILQQLLAVHEGIEAVKWLMEERSTLTSRCSSLTSSQYSLGDTSWRGSWSSLQDPNDRLDNISIGSYLDTLADDMDEYCPSSSESAITAAGRTGAVPGAGLRAGSQAGISENGGEVKNGTEVKGGPETGITCTLPMNGTGSDILLSSPQKKPEALKPDSSVCTKAAETGKGSPVSKGNAQTQAAKPNGVLEKASKQTSSPPCPGLKAKRGTAQSPKLQTHKNGKIDLESCKVNGKVHLEYDAHWRWVQSQEDVTFL